MNEKKSFRIFCLVILSGTTTLSIMTLSRLGLFVTLSIIVKSVIMVSVIMLSVIMLSVVMVSVVMVSVVAPSQAWLLQKN
jgi:hypothetical protein